MARTQKQLEAVCEKLGLELHRNLIRGGGDTPRVFDGWVIRGRRVPATAEQREELKAAVRAGETNPSSAAMELSSYRAWHYTVKSLWRVDSIVRLVEANNDLGAQSLGTICCVQGSPAEQKEEENDE